MTRIRPTFLYLIAWLFLVSVRELGLWLMPYIVFTYLWALGSAPAMWLASAVIFFWVGRRIPRPHKKGHLPYLIIFATVAAAFITTSWLDSPPPQDEQIEPMFDVVATFYFLPSFLAGCFGFFRGQKTAGRRSSPSPRNRVIAG